MNDNKLTAASDVIRKLKQLQTAFNRKCILAGGALREIYMGLYWHISDYDIFVDDSDNYLSNNIDVVENKLAEVFRTKSPLRQPEINQIFDSNYMTLDEEQESHAVIKPGSHEHISGVWEVDIGPYNGGLYQIMLVKRDPIEYVEKYFDFGMCKVWCDGKRIHYTADFLQDVKEHTLTLVGENLTQDQVRHALNHHSEKIRNKYPAFRVVVPERYQKYVEEGKSYPTC
jgi:hypothetical protein